MEDYCPIVINTYIAKGLRLHIRQSFNNFLEQQDNDLKMWTIFKSWSEVGIVQYDKYFINIYQYTKMPLKELEISIHTMWQNRFA